MSAHHAAVFSSLRALFRMSTLTNMYFLLKYGTRMEEQSGAGEHLWFLLSQIALTSAIGWTLNLPFMATSIVASHLYCCSRYVRLCFAGCSTCTVPDFRRWCRLNRVQVGPVHQSELVFRHCVGPVATPILPNGDRVYSGNACYLNVTLDCVSQVHYPYRQAQSLMAAIPHVIGMITG